MIQVVKLRRALATGVAGLSVQALLAFSAPPVWAARPTLEPIPSQGSNETGVPADGIRGMEGSQGSQPGVKEGKEKKSGLASERQAPPQPTPKEPAPPPPEAAQVVAQTFNEPGVLTPKGTLVVDSSFDYSHSSVGRVEIEGYTVLPAITIGSIDVTDVTRDTYTAAVALRWGLTGRTECDVKVPYVWRNDSTTARPLAQGATKEETTTVSGHGIGDIDFGIHQQLNQGKGGWPFFIANLRVKTHTGKGSYEVEADPDTGLSKELPTGSGFWGIQPSISMLLPADPAVFFGNLSYMWNIKRDFGDPYGEIEPGAAIGFQLGMGIGLNEKASLSLGYEHSIVGKSKQNGEALGSTLQVGVLRLGSSYRLTDSSRINIAVGAGLTKDAPDVQLTVSVPTSIRMWK